MHAKHTVTLCLTAALVSSLIAGTGTARAEYRLFDDFSDKVLGPVGGQDDWVSNGGDNAVVVDPADPFNQCLYVPSASSVLRKALAAENLSCPDNTSRVLFFRMRVANKQTFSVGLSPNANPSEYSDFAPELGMANSAPNLDLRVWDDDGGNYETLCQLSADTWYNVWIRVDTQGNCCEIWMNDMPGATASAADKLAASDGDETFEFRSGDASELRTFYIKTSGGSSGFGPTYFDDIYLETTITLSFCNPTSLVPGDCNCDGEIDEAEFAFLPDCLGGPDILPPDCSCLDMDDDADVDMHDVTAFQVLFGS